MKWNRKRKPIDWGASTAFSMAIIPRWPSLVRSPSQHEAYFLLHVLLHCYLFADPVMLQFLMSYFNAYHLLECSNAAFCLGTLPSDVQRPFHRTCPKDGPVLMPVSHWPLSIFCPTTLPPSRSDQTTPTHRPVSLLVRKVFTRPLSHRSPDCFL